MIFVTIGAQMPFDRLVRAVDAWAKKSDRTDVFSQIGPSSYQPTGMQWVRFLDPSQFQRRFEEADVVVAHAGTGSIITALQLGKPILIMPRRASLSETRNDHQIATAKRFSQFPSVSVAWDEMELVAQLDKIGEMTGHRSVGTYASPELLDTLREFIACGGSSEPGTGTMTKFNK